MVCYCFDFGAVVGNEQYSFRFTYFLRATILNCFGRTGNLSLHRHMQMRYLYSIEGFLVVV